MSEWVRTQIQLTKDQHDQVKRLAFDAGISMAEWLRRATEEKLARDTEDGWWCPTCRASIDGSRVTDSERCDTCGTYLGD